MNEIMCQIGKCRIYCSLIRKVDVYTFEELNPHACGFILSKCYPFTDLEKALRAVSNLQWCTVSWFVAT